MTRSVDIIITDAVLMYFSPKDLKYDIRSNVA